MAQEIVVKSGTLPSSSGTPSEFTETGFGAPVGVMIIAEGSSSGANPENGILFTTGLYNGSVSKRTVGIHSTYNVDETYCRRSQDDGLIGIFPAPFGGGNNEFTVDAITDGIRISLTVDNTTVNCNVTVIMIKGVSSAIFTFTPNATQNGTQVSPSLGFAPKAALVLCAGLGSADTTGTSQAIYSFGVATSDGQNHVIGCGNTTTQDISSNTLAYRNNRCCGQFYGGTTGWAGEITSWGSDTFTMTTRDGATGSDACYILVFGGADVSAEAGSLSTPTSTGNSTISLSNDPDVLITALTTLTAVGVANGVTSDGFCIGVSDGTNDVCHTVVEGDEVDFTNNRTSHSASKIIDLDEESSGFVNVADATCSFSGNDAVLNYTTVDGTNARQGFYFAFTVAGTGGGGGGEEFTPQFMGVT